MMRTLTLIKKKLHYLHSDVGKAEKEKHKRGKHVLVENLLGLLKVKVVRGVNLAVRDVHGCYPYVLVQTGEQKLRTKVKKKSINPEWDEELTFCIDDADVPFRLEVFDKHSFHKDESMGHAEFHIRPLVQAVKLDLSNKPSGTVIENIIPNRQNSLAEMSDIYWSEGKVMQDIALRLKDVIRGEIELKLSWIMIPGAKGLERISK
ncbi:Calcium-dependent lipid-binding (CaLB domain) family protein [Rhynchospora pubera]|uniref:Calcium-dependent lipid-binding (CaLB domain) family protein n=1 Tax=Rhynchospora pubera TaxID=906938 RepID=A0AAV8FD22_9POAL|nr:Calcium-dependent lipid-binding (CaLB domain) family protein [Rhynchospora pubera]